MIVYVKRHRRRPIRTGRGFDGGDVQAQIPFWWCDCCGKEVYARGHRLCQVCAERKGAMQ